MNKKEFMLKLKENLIGMDQSEKREILLDYGEHFFDGKNTGRTEEEICDSLGDPKEIALSLQQTKKDSVTKSGSNAGNILGIIGLSLGCLWLLRIIIALIGATFGTILGIIAVFTLPLGVGITITAIASLVFSLSLMVLIIFGIIKLIVLICRWFQSLFNGLENRPPNTREFKMFRPKAWIWIVVISICVLSFFFMIFGAVRVAADFAIDYENGEFDEMIVMIEDRVNDEEFITTMQQLEELEHMDNLEALAHLENIDLSILREFVFEILD